MDSKIWVKIVFISSFLIIGIESGFNYLIDPYKIYNNYMFPQYQGKDRITASVNLKINQYNNIIIGTSRTQSAIDIVNKNFIGQTYNASMSGSNVYEIHKVFQYIYKNQNNIKQIIYGLDFLTFSNKRYPRENFNQSLYGENNSYNNLLFTTLLSMDTLKDSFNTVRKSFNNRKDVVNHGYKDRNHRKNYDYEDAAKKILTNNFLVRDESYGCYTYGLDRLDLFERILIGSTTKNVDLVLFITPLQYRHIIALKHLGLFDKYIKWIYDLKIIVDNINNKYSSNILLYDFSYVNKITSESIGKQNSSKFYWESSHYKSEVGDMIIDSINHKNNFGILLNNVDIDIYLKKYINDYFDLFQKSFNEYMDIYKLYLSTTNTRISNCSKYNDIDTVLSRPAEYNPVNSYNNERGYSIEKVDNFESIK